MNIFLKCENRAISKYNSVFNATIYITNAKEAMGNHNNKKNKFDEKIDELSDKINEKINSDGGRGGAGGNRGGSNYGGRGGSNSGGQGNGGSNPGGSNGQGGSGNGNQNGSNQGNNKKPNPANSRTTTIVWVVLAIIVAVVVASQIVAAPSANSEDIDTLTTSEFTQAVDQGRVNTCTYASGEYKVSGTYYPVITAGADGLASFNKAFEALNAGLHTKGSTLNLNTKDLSSTKVGEEKKYTATFVGSDSIGELMASHPEVQYTVTLPSGLGNIISTWLPLIFIAVIFIFFLTQMQKATNSQMGFGKTKAKKASEERPEVKFSDVAGVDEAVEEMAEIKDFLSSPAKYQAMGAKIPRGCLLVGPPGTGKTLLARAVAGEAGVPFFSISGSDFVEMFVGVGASRVRDLFQQAKDAAPSIIFIDEIDAVGRQRGAGVGGGHDEREQTLNQLLVEMDGFDKTESVVLIAATNRADILDPALLRPGRFDRQIVVDRPTVEGRKKILEVHAKDKPIGSDVDISRVASLTSGFTGADLMNLMNESALLTARKNKKVITMAEVTAAFERVIAGPERKSKVMNEDTKRIIAYHESGHALVGHMLPKADPVHKISIISRGQALGYTLSVPDEDKVLNSVGEMQAELAVFMGGRVAEEIFCGDVTTGASNDLERATKMARSMVMQYGMSSNLGQQVFGEANHEVFLGRDYGTQQNYSDDTAKRIDDEIARIMKEAHDTAYEILSSHKDQMYLMASVLMERETVDGEECKALLDNKWDDYLAREDDIKAALEAEEAAARAKDEQLIAAGELHPAEYDAGAAGGAGAGGSAGGADGSGVAGGAAGSGVRHVPVNPYAVQPKDQGARQDAEQGAGDAQDAAGNAQGSTAGQDDAQDTAQGSTAVQSPVQGQDDAQPSQSSAQSGFTVSQIQNPAPGAPGAGPKSDQDNSQNQQ